MKDEQIIIQMLKEWICAIQEDNPLPYEIKNIYFILDFSNNDIELSYSGDDLNLSIFDYGSYQPLEAEYFLCNQLKKMAKNLCSKKSKLSKKQIFEWLKNLCFFVCNSLDFLKNKNIFFGERFKSVKYKYAK